MFHRTGAHMYCEKMICRTQIVHEYFLIAYLSLFFFLLVLCPPLPLCLALAHSAAELQSLSAGAGVSAASVCECVCVDVHCNQTTTKYPLTLNTLCDEKPTGLEMSFSSNSLFSFNFNSFAERKACSSYFIYILYNSILFISLGCYCFSSSYLRSRGALFTGTVSFRFRSRLARFDALTCDALVST